MRTVATLSLLVSLAACQPGDATVGPAPDAHFAVRDSSVTHPMRAPSHDRDRAQVESVMRERMYEGVRPMTSALYAAIGSEDWREGDRLLRQFLTVPHADPGVQSFREVRVASGYLPGHLVNNDPLTPDKQGAIAYYTTILIENRQAGRAGMTDALDRLVGYWPESKLAEARRLVAEAQRHADRARS